MRKWDFNDNSELCISEFTFRQKLVFVCYNFLMGKAQESCDFFVIYISIDTNSAWNSYTRIKGLEH